VAGGFQNNDKDEAGRNKEEAALQAGRSRSQAFVSNALLAWFFFRALGDPI